MNKFTSIGVTANPIDLDRSSCAHKLFYAVLHEHGYRTESTTIKNTYT